MTTEQATSELNAAGAKLERREDRSGKTLAGWWLDGVYLGKDARTAAEGVRG